MSFAEAMLEIDRKDEVRWAAEQIAQTEVDGSPILDGPFRMHGCPRLPRLLLRIGDFHKADAAIANGSCLAQRAEIAKLYAKHGETGRASEVAHQVLADLPAYMQSLTEIFDGPRLADTAQPLIAALAFAGDRERALKEMQSLEHFARNRGRTLAGFAGASLTLDHLAQTYYEIGEELKGDALTVADQYEHSSWSKAFTIAYWKCANGKPNCLDTLLSFSGETIDFAAGAQIFGWAFQAGRHDVTIKTIERQFHLSDAWLLYYTQLCLEMFANDVAAAETTLRLLLTEERRRGDPLPLQRCFFLLRVAVALGNRDLAMDAARLVLSRIFAEGAMEAAANATVSDRGAHWDWDPTNRITLLAQSAGALAQLEQ